MGKSIIATLKRSFDEIAHTHVDNSDSVEYWYARELQQLLGYSRWKDFEKAVRRGITACENTGAPVENPFREVPKRVRLGSGSHREVRDYMLTRYACYKKLAPKAHWLAGGMKVPVSYNGIERIGQIPQDWHEHCFAFLLRCNETQRVKTKEWTSHL